MTRDELKVKIREIFLNDVFSKEVRTVLLGQLFIEFVPEGIRMDAKQLPAMRNFGETWNSAIVEVVRSLPDDHFVVID